MVIGLVYCYFLNAEPYYVGYTIGKHTEYVLARRHISHLYSGKLEFDSALRQIGEEKFKLSVLHSTTAEHNTLEFAQKIRRVEDEFISKLKPKYNNSKNRTSHITKPTGKSNLEFYRKKIRYAILQMDENELVALLTKITG